MRELIQIEVISLGVLVPSWSIISLNYNNTFTPLLLSLATKVFH